MLLTGLIERALKLAGTIGHPKTRAVWLMRHQLTWDREMSQGRTEAAIDLFRTNLDAANNAEQTAETHGSLSQCYFKLGRHEEALAEIQKALDVLRVAHGPDYRSWRTGMIRSRIGQTLLKLGRPADAEPELVAAYEELVEHLAEMPEYDRDHFTAARQFVLDAYQALQRPENVKTWADGLIRRLETNLKKIREAPSPAPRTVIQLVRALGLAYIDAGRPADAARLHAQAIADLEAAGWPRDAVITITLNGLPRAAYAGGHVEAADTMRANMIAALEPTRHPGRPARPRILLDGLHADDRPPPRRGGARVAQGPGDAGRVRSRVVERRQVPPLPG